MSTASWRGIRWSFPVTVVCDRHSFGNLFLHFFHFFHVLPYVVIYQVVMALQRLGIDPPNFDYVLLK
jgi:hypothetical protein